MEEVNQFINNETISEIVILNDIQYAFICNIVNKDKNHNTKAELELEKLQKSNATIFQSLNLSQQNIY